MRISKLYLVVCAAALGAGVVTIRADDNPAQAAARAALEEKMRALNAQSAHTNAPTSAPVMSKKPARPAVTTVPATPPPLQNPPPAAPAAPEKPAPVAVTPSGAAVRVPTNPPPATMTMPATPPAVARVQTPAPVAPEQPVPIAVTPSGATVRQPTNPPSATTTLPATSSAVALARKPAPATSTSNHSLFAPVPPPSGSGPAGTATQTTQPSTNVQTPPPPATPLPQKPASAGPPPNDIASYGKELGLKPIVAPPLPITSAQQAELQALLEKYEANAITPGQYQTERAKILAEH